MDTAKIDWRRVRFSTPEDGWAKALTYETAGDRVLPFLRALKEFDRLRRSACGLYLLADAVRDTGGPEGDFSSSVVVSSDVDWTGFPEREGCVTC